MVTARFFRYGKPVEQGTVLMLQTLETTWAPRVLSIARVVSALIFMSHGTQKLINFPPRANNAPGPDLFSLYGLAGSLEIVGGILLVFGLFTRRSRSSLGRDGVAYCDGHAPRAMYPVLNGGDAAILYCFGSLSRLAGRRRLEPSIGPACSSASAKVPVSRSRLEPLIDALTVGNHHEQPVQHRHAGNHPRLLA